MEDADVDIESIRTRGKILSRKWMKLLQECQFILEHKRKAGLMFQTKCLLYYGIYKRNFYRQDMSKVITLVQGYFTRQK